MREWRMGKAKDEIKHPKNGRRVSGRSSERNGRERQAAGGKEAGGRMRREKGKGEIKYPENIRRVRRAEQRAE